jgi:hypothetical protein
MPSSRNTRKRKNSIHIPSIKSLLKNLSRKACPPGMVERKSHVRKFSTAIREKGYTVKRASGTTYRVYPKTTAASVKSVCVKEKGKSQTKTMGPRSKGELNRLGYSYKESEQKRHAALRRAIGKYGAIGVFTKLKNTAEIVKRVLPSAAHIYESDRDWVKEKFLKTA